MKKENRGRIMAGVALVLLGVEIALWGAGFYCGNRDMLNVAAGAQAANVVGYALFKALSASGEDE